MELHQLRYFVAAAEAGTMSRAAARCGVAQPSLSQQIKKLEQSLGTALFDRLGRGIALTDAGRVLLPRAKRILAEVNEAESRLEIDIADGLGPMSIGGIPTIAPYLLPQALAQIHQEMPDCDISVCEDLTENLIDQLLDNRIDVALLSTPVEHDLIQVQVIGSEQMMVVVPSDHPLCRVSTVGLADLRTEPTITLNEIHCLGQQIAGFCTSRGLARHVTCRTTQLQTVLEFVRRGLGISLVPEMVATLDECKERTYLRLGRGAPRREIALAWRKGRTRGTAVVRFEQATRAALTALQTAAPSR